MVRIAVCDEKETDCYAVRDLVQSVLNEYGIEYKVDLFFEAEHLFRALHDRLFDMIVTELSLDGQDMIDFTRRLMAERYPVRVLFVTASETVPSLPLPNLGVLKKPLDKEALCRTIEYVTNFRVLSRRLYVAAKNGEKYRISETDIRYIEVFRNDLCIYLADRKIVCRNTLLDFTDRLSSACFVRCHRSFAVNLSFVTSVRRYHAVMQDGSTVPISKTRYIYVRDCFLAQNRKV